MKKFALSVLAVALATGLSIPAVQAAPKRATVAAKVKARIKAYSKCVRAARKLNKTKRKAAFKRCRLLAGKRVKVGVRMRNLIKKIKSLVAKKKTDAALKLLSRIKNTKLARCIKSRRAAKKSIISCLRLVKLKKANIKAKAAVKARK